LGLKFEEIQGAQRWHPDVRLFQVNDLETKEFLGHFYLDLYPREFKYNHAAVFPLIQRSFINGKYTAPAVAMVVNFERGKEAKDSLLSHDNVITFFHEFGHVMHNLCTKGNFTSMSGAQVEGDFVEMPSQMLENWVWDTNMTKRLSKHYETGEPMSDEMIAKISKVGRDGQASDTLY
jgi:Zn-dependent oligopeptidase